MKKHESRTKLRLHRQTVHTLLDRQLLEARGGVVSTDPPTSNDVRCPTGP
jgi:hypothetical protein